MTDFSNYIPVRAISTKGSLLISALRNAYAVRRFLGFKNWEYPLQGHHEDPIKMTLKESLYLGYKYYYRPMLAPDAGSGLDEYFSSQTLSPDLPNDFEAETKVTISAGGDLMPYSAIRRETCAELWDDVGDFFFGSDLVLANLETPIDASKPVSLTPEVMLGDMYFNGSEEQFNIFNGNGHHKGFDLLSVANNHSLDMGVEGLMQTMVYLRSKDILTAGASGSEHQAEQIPMLVRQGIRFAFLAATFSLNKREVPAESPWLCNHILLNEPIPDISLLIRQSQIAVDQGADMLIALLHMGLAYQAYPGSTIVQNIHSICDQTGIDIIIAGHPHHAQPIEIYKSPVTGKQHCIIYSLGDFIAYDIFKWGQLPLMLKLTIVKGNTQLGPRTLVQKIQVRPAFMHAVIKSGKVRKLKLLDYLRIRSEPGLHLKDSRELRHFNELKAFLERFVIRPGQEHVFL